jgi:hypothetical protein
MTKRKDQQNIWTNRKFAKKLEQIKRKKSALEDKDFSVPDITGLILNTPAFKDVEEQILKKQDMIGFDLRIKMDRKRK